MTVEDQLNLLRQSWVSIPTIAGESASILIEFLEERLADLIARDALDEHSLLAAVEDASQLALSLTSKETGRDLSKRLRRTVYEYLLSLDAISPEETREQQRKSEPPPPPPPVPTAEDEPLEQGPPPSHIAAVAPVPPVVTGEEKENVEATPTATDPEVLPSHDDGVPVEEAAPPTAHTNDDPVSDAPAPPLDGVAPVAPEMDDDSQGQPHIAPKEGFHLTDPSDFKARPRVSGSGPLTRRLGTPHVDTPAPLATVADEPSSDEAPPVQPDTEPPHEDEALEGDDAASMQQRGTWATRLRRRHRVEEDQVPLEPDDSSPPPAPTPADEPTPAPSPTYTYGALEATDEALNSLRNDIDQFLRKKKCAEAAALLQQTAQETGGRHIAELALDAGDRCRGMGKRHAATNCYLAASRADPVYEMPLQRLADYLLDEQEIDQAVAYMERIARLTRLRGDTIEAMRVYRKIVNIAPYREDILEILMRAQATGNIDG